MGNRATSDIFFGLLVEPLYTDNVAIRDMLYNKIDDKFSLIDKGAVDGENILYLGIKESHLHTDWDEPAEANKLFNKHHPEERWRGELRAFCAQHNIEWEEPRWLLTAYYG